MSHVHMFSGDLTSDSKCCCVDSHISNKNRKGKMGDNTGSNQLSRWHLARITGPVVFFSIILPFIDNVTDLTMIVRLYYGVDYCKHYCPSYYGMKTCDGYRECRENATTFCKENKDTATCAFRRYTILATTLLCKRL